MRIAPNRPCGPGCGRTAPGRPALPTNGELVAEHTAGGAIDPAAYEAEYQARIAAQMY